MLHQVIIYIKKNHNPHLESMLFCELLVQILFQWSLQRHIWYPFGETEGSITFFILEYCIKIVSFTVGCFRLVKDGQRENLKHANTFQHKVSSPDNFTFISSTSGTSPFCIKIPTLVDDWLIIFFWNHEYCVRVAVTSAALSFNSICVFFLNFAKTKNVAVRAQDPVGFVWYTKPIFHIQIQPYFINRLPLYIIIS